MLSDVLRSLNDSGELTAKEIASLLNLVPSSAYRLMTDVDPRFGQYRTIFRQCRSRSAKEELLAVLLDGTGFIAAYVDADPRGDRTEVNTGTALDTTLQGLSKLSSALRDIRQADSKGMRQLAQTTAAGIQAHLRETIKDLVATEEIIAFLAHDKFRLAI